MNKRSNTALNKLSSQLIINSASMTYTDVSIDKEGDKYYMKSVLREAAHLIDSHNIWVDGDFLKNARGEERKLTIKDKILIKFFKVKPSV